jgi:phage shock protein E
MRRMIVLLAAFALAVAACGGTDVIGVETVSPSKAAEVVADAPADLVVLDIRTPEEYAAGTIEGSVNIDFYAADFADQLAALDRDATYVLFCRSGNRSATAAQMMRDLDFAEVYEINGGIVAWSQAGQPIALP